jgi:TRAP-type C4-dicarboxylate transport system permease small subunit
MKKVLAGLQKIEDWVLVGGFVIMALGSFAQVVNRNIVHAGISWFEELARYAMVYMALLAAEAGLRDGTQISITAFTDKLPTLPRKVMQIVVKVIVIGFSSVVFFSSFTLLKSQLITKQLSPGLRIPMFVPYFGLTLGFGIIVIVQLAALVLLILRFNAPPEGGSQS